MGKAILSFGFAIMTFALLSDEALITADAEKEGQISSGAELSDSAKTGKKAYLLKGTQTVYSLKITKIDPNKFYEASVWVKAAGAKPTFGYLGIASYDAQKRYIAHEHVMDVKNSLTELAEACQPTDTAIKIKDGAEWNKGAAQAVAFNAKADKSDIPNRNVVFMKSIKKNGDVYEVTLDKPVGKAYAAGTKVRQHIAGGFIYPKYGKVPTEWTLWKSKPIKGSDLRAGVWARVVMLCNYPPCTNESMLFDDLTFKECK